MVFTLLFVVFLSMIFEARDDINRHRKDHETNNAKGHVIVPDDEDEEKAIDKKITWKEFEVGDLVLVRSGQAFPVDLVLLTSSELDGNCYVETANIDGETNLKLRLAAKKLSDKLQGGVLGDLKTAMNNTTMHDLELEATAPNSDINSFMGTLKSAEGEFALSSKQFLHRGSVLRNTTWVIGLAVYTGSQSKIILNSSDPPLKRGTIDRTIDRILYVVVLAQCGLVTIAMIGYVIWEEINIYKKDDLGYYSTWYLIPKGESASSFIFPNWLAIWFSYFILFNNFVPINLYVTMDIVNLFQGLFINNDLEMYCEETDTAASARASNLCQELGMIEYIFSDKTGTLTQNVMKLKKVAIGPTSYGHTNAEGFETAEIIADMKEGNTQIREFLTCLAVAHTVVTDKEGHYQAESPDEAALVDGVTRAGFKFVSRRGETVRVEIHGKPVEYVVEAVNTFSSKRKRMSVVVKKPDGGYVLLIKGADNMIFDRCDEKSTDREQYNDHLDAYSNEGLRTLLVAQREISDEEFKIWKEKYDKASTTVGKQRKTLLGEVAEEIEKDLQILGVTAIEDKLQDDVADTISNLADAGIKLWVLTGDKVETAINIGYSCKVLQPGMTVLRLTDTQPEKINLRLENLVRQLRGVLQEKDDADDVPKKGELQKANLDHLALVITGPTLKSIMDNDFRRGMLLELSIACKVVIACRVSPLQKALLVEMVREGIKPEPITLAIGDGANDVTMIQKAHVGVGISGNEGQQAANVSDFSISRFKYLQRLLLVHGRWNYRRMCKLILYCFYKNFCITLTLFYYAATAAFSGTSVYDSWVYVSFNFHTMLPICAVGALDQDVRAETVMQFPALYLTGRLNLDLNTMLILQHIFLAIIHSVIVVFWPYFSYFGLDQVDLGGHGVFGTIIFSCLVFAVTYRVMLITVTWTGMTVLMLFLSFLCFFVFMLVYGVWYDLGPEFYWVPYQMFGTPVFWVVLFAVPATALFIDFVVLWICREYLPTVTDFAMEADYEMNKKRHGVMMNEVLNKVKEMGREQIKSSQAVLPEQRTRRNHKNPCSFSSTITLIQLSEEIKDIDMAVFDQKQGDVKKDDAKEEAEAKGEEETQPTDGYAFSHPGEVLASLHRSMTTSNIVVDEKQLKNAAAIADEKEKKALPKLESHKSDSLLQEEIKLDLQARKAENEAEDTQLESHRPPDESTWCGRFLQQKLPRLQKPLTPRVTIIVLTVVGCLFLLLGGLVMWGSANAQYQMVHYDGNSDFYETEGFTVNRQDCHLPAERNQGTRVCNLTMTLEQDMNSPVYVHYGLTNFFQNYQSYLSDRDSRQLHGTTADPTPGYCKYYVKDGDDTYLPCGLMANSMFNDTFKLMNPDLEMREDQIAWEVDRTFRFRNPDGYPEICDDNYLCLYELYPGIISREDGFKDEHFMVWMRAAALDTFMNKYGRIDQDLKKGDTVRRYCVKRDNLYLTFEHQLKTYYNVQTTTTCDSNTNE